MIGEFMFGFGCGGDFPESKPEPERKSEGRKQGTDYSRFQKFREKAKEQKVTITRDEFMHKCADVSMFGEFATELGEHDPGMRFRYPLLLAPFIADLANAIFGEIEEDGENGRKEKS